MESGAGDVLDPQPMLEPSRRPIEMPAKPPRTSVARPAEQRAQSLLVGGNTSGFYDPRSGLLVRACHYIRCGYIGDGL
jgi:hypothetical protein